MNNEPLRIAGEKVARERVIDPMTAYQITSMMQGVVTRGTAAS